MVIFVLVLLVVVLLVVVVIIVVKKILTSFWNTFGKKVSEISGNVVVSTCFTIPNQREQ